MPWSLARSTIFLATANRTSGSSEMPVSSFEIAMTAAPYFLTSGSTDSRRSSSPVTELTSALPLYTARPASSAATIDESIDSGTSVIDCTSWTGAREDRRFVGERYAGVDVEHVRAGLDLRARIGFDAAEVAGRHFRGQNLAPGRIDALADDDEGPVEADHDLLRCGTD